MSAAQTSVPSGRTGFGGLYVLLSDGTYQPVIDSTGAYDGPSLTRSQASAAFASKSVVTQSQTVATTGNTDWYVIVPETGTLSSADFSGIDALAANDTNYLTFSITNLGQAGAGTTVMLAATDANTTKATGGTALAANTKRSLTISGTAGNLAVTQGDRLRIRAAATGTLAGTVTGSVLALRFAGTT